MKYIREAASHAQMERARRNGDSSPAAWQTIRPRRVRRLLTTISRESRINPSIAKEMKYLARGGGSIAVKLRRLQKFPKVPFVSFHFWNKSRPSRVRSSALAFTRRTIIKSHLKSLARRRASRPRSFYFCAAAGTAPLCRSPSGNYVVGK